MEGKKPGTNARFMRELIEVVNELGSAIDVEENVIPSVENERPVDVGPVEISGENCHHIDEG